MESLTLDMVQYDCPYIDTTDDHEVSYYAMQWDFNTARRELETRIVVTGQDRGALDDGLRALRDHDNMLGYDLLSRRDDRAVIRSRIEETNAMSVVRDHKGYITGPFEIRDGSELWHVGFDSDAVADDALASLERRNDFDVLSWDAIDPADYFDLLRNVTAAKRLLDSVRNLSDVERATIESAAEEGYFETPRDGTLATLAGRFDVSKTAVSKNLRRGQRKIFDSVVATFPEVEE